ncbi:Alanine racemase [Polystyrenella longa]|uniref:Alanine racemase n=1 Tax=Polystyrenella longa TaxID=2528007 RepID=A0A518CIH5_9PLAN|nr:alanine/ornithine racemase family PLP-dependent enzyme [Polystyrenella longa]QDU79020.1 Alanine racemase [Polystyrenella longa]
MNAPRLEIDLSKVYDNTRILVELLGDRGISVTGMTKASLGCPEIAEALIRAGVSAIGDSRIENIQNMRHHLVPASMILTRSPMLSQVEEIVKYADVSFNTELEVIRKLSAAAGEANQVHGIVLMVELGDLREGIMPEDMLDVVREVIRIPNIVLKGIGANLACRNGVSPDGTNMSELSALANLIETTFNLTLEIVSGGSSANLNWALSGAGTGRINDLRLGESILLGREPLHRQAIDGLHADAITLVAEVIESKVKPSQPWGEIAQNAFGEKLTFLDRGRIPQAILAIGHQDTDPHGLQPPAGIDILGASSDHLIVESNLPVGSEITFQLNYSALARAMTSPFIARVMKHQGGPIPEPVA